MKLDYVTEIAPDATMPAVGDPIKVPGWGTYLVEFINASGEVVVTEDGRLRCFSRKDYQVNRLVELEFQLIEVGEYFETKDGDWFLKVLDGFAALVMVDEFNTVGAIDLENIEEIDLETPCYLGKAVGESQSWGK